MARIENFYQALKTRDDDWDFAFITGKTNQYYFTGTMQNGVLVVTQGGDICYFVRRSVERARAESPLAGHIYPMQSYGDMAKALNKNTRRIYLEKENTTCAMLEKMGKYFDVSPPRTRAADGVIQRLRAVKSPYELACIREAGRQHRVLMEDVIPTLLREGTNEAELCAQIYEKMIALGHHGVSRFGSFQTEMMVGQISFGENSLYPTNFDGPGGMRGLCPAVPLVGDRDRRLKKGDLVFVDVGYGCCGYHSDCTRIYMLGDSPPPQAVHFHRQCLRIQKEAAERLKPGAIPSQIYAAACKGLDDAFFSGFMGTREARVRFLGHGIGLQVDEYPVIAKKFDEPLRENMVLALEPKCGIPGFGMVGAEDTFIVTPGGGACVTGGGKDIIVV